MRKISSWVSALALVLSTGLVSFAGYAGTGGSINGSIVGKSPNTGTLSQAFTLVRLTSAVGSDSGTGGFPLFTGDFDDPGFDSKQFFIGQSGVGNGTSNGLSFDAGPLSVGTPFTFTSAGFGTFDGSVVSDDADTTMTQTSRQIRFVGNYTPGGNSAFNGNTSVLYNTTFQITLAKSAGDSSATHSGSWSMDTTGGTAAVPEPTSIAIFSLGAAGFAVRRLRRK